MLEPVLVCQIFEPRLRNPLHALICSKNHADCHRSRGTVAANLSVGLCRLLQVVVFHDQVNSAWQHTFRRARFSNLDGLRPPDIPEACHGSQSQIICILLFGQCPLRVRSLVDLVQGLFDLLLDKTARGCSDLLDRIHRAQALVNNPKSNSCKELSAIQCSGLPVSEHHRARCMCDVVFLVEIPIGSSTAQAHSVGHASELPIGRALLNLR
mmetsp:Transcript_114730/g.370946  ORF Transcript_114730/g.370946 Transcript_114730/m.370946 type:complete len:211 (-) Transcript_114730:511-1143(-)